MEIYCDKIFTCDETEAYRQYLGGSKDACIDSMTSANDSEGSEDDCENYNSAKADECISCYKGLSCSEFSSMMNEETDPCPVCDEVCE